MVRETNLLKLLEKYKPFNEFEALNIQQLKQFLSYGENHYCRSNKLAHIVADAWIVNHDFTKTLLVKHAESGLWQAPGGHCDANPDVYAGAIREAEEETGLNNLVPLSEGLFDINVGIVPTRIKPTHIEPTHLHFDVCFAFIASEKEPLKISDESTDLCWVNIEDVKNLNIIPEHIRRVEKTLL